MACRNVLAPRVDENPDRVACYFGRLGSQSEAGLAAVKMFAVKRLWSALSSRADLLRAASGDDAKDNGAR
jgi:hypothetical protein